MNFIISMVSFLFPTVMIEQTFETDLTKYAGKTG